MVKLIVLIFGESGVGKEVFVKVIYEVSEVVKVFFILINCGVILEVLFESELFGYECGVFFGVNSKGKKGKIEFV